MGYTHYFHFNKDVNKFKEEFLKDVKQVLGARNKTIRLEFDSKKPYMTTEEMVRFNGVDEEGHETFLITPKEQSFGFCKTARKPYDYYVVQVLLLAKYYYKELFSLASDGFWVTEEDFFKNEFDGEWAKALKKIQKDFGYEFVINREISASDDRFYFKNSIDTESEKIDIEAFGEWVEKKGQTSEFKDKMFKILKLENEKTELYSQEELLKLSVLMKNLRRRKKKEEI